MGPTCATRAHQHPPQNKGASPMANPNLEALKPLLLALDAAHL
jgi:hypothetical protein